MVGCARELLGGGILDLRCRDYCLCNVWPSEVRMQYRVLKADGTRSGMFKVVEIHDVSLHETESDAKRMVDKLNGLVKPDTNKAE